ncbi:hypothetical protein BA190_04795 [Labrys sp. WJW]|uniref:hypothetical protein n=1 Tax=Labrys sp. WJW TaxID=1737983 RepID=UPI00082ACB7C|nr:hypothetical protein [Labrys sp. WJW]OCC06044.1 hypothetical protein BA190_04795 [Labrys sp. WJW]
MSDDRWNRYLFERHDRQEIAQWARRLRYFRFCRAVGGHANDGDELLLAIALQAEVGLVDVCAGLGIVLDAVAPGSPQPGPGVAYTAEAYQGFASIVPGTKGIRQPGHIQLAGQPVYVHARANRLEISLSDPDAPYEVREATIRSAEQVETLLAPLAGRLIDPPRTSRHCVCPAFYPEMWN